MHSLLLLLCLFAFLDSNASTQTPTFKSTTRVVLVDVVVTDSHGQPVHDLKARDFTVLDNGAPQGIVAFEEHRADAAPITPRKLNLPENVYTNYVTRSEPGALTVLLFDSLNTAPQDLTYARNKMLSFIKGLPLGTRVAVYALGPQLRLVHSFTENSDELIAAARELSAHPQLAYSSVKEFTAEIDELKHSGIDKVPGALRAMTRFLGEEYEGKQEWRAQDTLDVFTQLAHALAVVPGRKNLIWISSAFPFDFSRDAPRLQSVAGLLAANRIAVYPIDARGIVATGPDGQVTGSEAYAQRSEGFSARDQENIDLIETMRSIAEITGGRAHFNTNDLAGAMSDSMRTASNYYTLAYRPSGVLWNGHFRKIAIKTPHPHLKLLYRSGYYAISDPFDSKEDPSRIVARAMQPTVPVSTQFIMKAKVVPPEISGQTTRIDFFIDVHELTLTELNGQKTPLVDFVAVAWDANGKEQGRFSEEFHTVSEADYQSLLKTGLRVHQEMQLEPGSYQLRLGVMDRLSGRIGTLDVPLTVAGAAAK
jgi:VWFA-related protein